MAESLSLNDVVRQVDNLVTLPGVFVRINRMVDDPHCSLQAIGEVIAQDPGLTVRLLRMANSVFFGLSHEIDTVPRAVAVIGTRRVRDLIMATSMVKAFDEIPADITSLEAFWRHSIHCGLIARELAKTARLREPESLFVTGLLHDIGRLVMLSYYPDRARRALARSLSEEGILQYQCERDEFGFDHAQLGAALARHWQLPELLIEGIELHHQPRQAEAHPQHVAIVHLANALSLPSEYARTEIAEPKRLDPAAWSQAGLQETAGAEACAGAEAQYNEMYQMLRGDVG